MSALAVAMLSLLVEGTLLASAIAAVGGLVFGGLALRSWRSGVILADTSIVCRGYVKTFRVPRHDVTGAEPVETDDNIIVDAWLPRLQLTGGRTIDLRPLARYSLREGPPSSVVAVTERISDWARD